MQRMLSSEKYHELPIILTVFTHLNSAWISSVDENSHNNYIDWAMHIDLIVELYETVGVHSLFQWKNNNTFIGCVLQNILD